MKIRREIVIREIKKSIDLTNQEIEVHGFKVKFDESSLIIEDLAPDKKCLFCSAYSEKKEEVSISQAPLNDLRKYDKISELQKLEKDSHCLQEFCHLIKYYKPEERHKFYNIDYELIKQFVLSALVGAVIVLSLLKRLWY